MTSIPSNFDRVPTRLASQITQRNITASNAQVLRAQVQLSSGRRVLRPSDDPIAASLVGVIRQRLDLAEQRGRNLSHASSVLGTVDQALEHLNDAIREASEIASSQVGVGSDAGTRRQQAVVVQSLLESVVQTLNRDHAGLYVFGGSRTADRPIVPFHGGFRYVGAGEGLTTDLGEGITFPITLGADAAAGALSARHRGDVDLNPLLTLSTRIADLRGPGGANAALGTLSITIDNGTPTTVDVDLSAAETVGDAARMIESAIRSTDPAALGGAFPSAVGVSGERLAIGSISAGYTITFADGPTGATATNLGLAGFTFDGMNAVNTDPSSTLNPRLTDDTPLGSLNPSAPVAFGTITFRNGGRTGTVATNAGMTIGQFKEAVARLNLGVRVEIDSSGDRINVVNEVSGFRMSVEESGGTAATTLGIRTLSAATALSVFNGGRGVAIADGQVNPVTGLPDPNRNVDFRITLSDGSSFTVDLVPEDLVSVQALLDRINAEAAGAGLGAVFSAGLSASGNGIEFMDSSGGAGQMSVTSLNGYAAADLGLLDGTFTAGPPGRLVSSDRSAVRVDSVLSALIDLRDALERNDSIGITFAGGRLTAGAELAVQSRSSIGGRARRIEEAKARLEDTMLLDQSIKSDLVDLDYVEAATRFALLQTQLQAGLQSAGIVRSLTLLNFLR